MEMDIEEMFGVRRAESDRGSGSEPDEYDDDDQDDRGENNPMEEAVEVPGTDQQAASKIVKPKRVIKNPQPKIDVHRLGGPRGILVLQKSFKEVKWKGKGHEKEDLDILLKGLEHWAHRMFPKHPFGYVLEQVEKQGFKKSVQVLMKKVRLDMVSESLMSGENPDEDNVRRGIDDEEQVVEEPAVDIFDELLGQNAFSTPAATPVHSAPSVPAQNKMTLTEEQRERVERNRRMAEEKRLARLKKQQEEEDRLRQQEEDAMSSMDQTSVFDDLRGNTTITTNEVSNTQNNEDNMEADVAADGEKDGDETQKNMDTKFKEKDDVNDEESKEEGNDNKDENKENKENDKDESRENEEKNNEEDKEKENDSDGELVIAENNNEEEKDKDLHTADDLLEMMEDD